MRFQQVSVDVWKMLVAAFTYLAMALGVWILLRLVSACFWLPGHLIKQREEEEKLAAEQEEKYPQEEEEGEEEETKKTQ